MKVFYTEKLGFGLWYLVEKLLNFLTRSDRRSCSNKKKMNRKNAISIYILIINFFILEYIFFMIKFYIYNTNF